MREDKEFETGDQVFILRSNGVTKGVVIDYDECEGFWVVLTSEDEKLLVSSCELVSAIDKPSKD